MLDGGCLYVPDGEYSEMLALYAECLQDGERLYLCERPSRFIRFYADMDISVDAGCDVDAFEEDLIVAFCVSCALVGLSSRVLVLAAPRKLDEECGRVKLGLHLILPETRVSIDEAERLRELVLVHLKASTEPPMNTWEDAFDASVYRQGGLRMIGSRKMTACGCAFDCDHPGRRLDAGRPYVMRSVRDAVGAVDEAWGATLCANHILRARTCSIRTTARDSDPEPELEQSQRKKRRRIGGSGGKMLCEYVRSGLNAQNKTAIVQSVIESNGNTLMRLGGDAARFCPHVGRDHKQSTVYVQITGGVALLRCHCKKGTCRRLAAPLVLSSDGMERLGLVSHRGMPAMFV